MITEEDIEKAAWESSLGYSSSHNDSFKEGAHWVLEQVKNCSILDIVGRSEQLKAEGRKEATEEIRQWLIDMDYEGLAESL